MWARWVIAAFVYGSLFTLGHSIMVFFKLFDFFMFMEKYIIFVVVFTPLCMASMLALNWVNSLCLDGAAWG